MANMEATILRKLFNCDNNTDLEKWEYTPIKEFYSRSNILITGSTGFLGRVLIEKLIRSCPNISKFYLLIRNKKGQSMETRLGELFEGALFQRMKKVCPDFLTKVIGIQGDCLLPDLGLSEHDKSLLINEVNIIFHAAATVRFDEKLKTAAAINVRGTRDVLRLAQQMPRLKSLLHISTAYSNCPLMVIEEKIYPAAMDYEKLLVMTENFPEDVLNNVTTRVVGKYPNTYAFTKQIAEDVVKREGQGLPVGISRPSIVISIYKEPIRGWINNLYGPTGVALGAGLGVLRVMQFDKKKNANLVPADMYVNSLIASAWEVGATFDECRKNNLKYEIPLYNYESSNEKPLTWGVFMELTSKYGVVIPSINCIWYYSLGGYPYTLQFILAKFFLHTLPAFLTDKVLIFKGKSPRMMEIYSKIHRMCNAMCYFALREWKFTGSNVRQLLTKMSDKDKEIFYFDIKDIDWDDYFQTYMPGGRLYVLNDPIETLPEAKKKWTRFYWAHQTIKAVGGLLLIWFLWYMISLAVSYFL